MHRATAVAMTTLVLGVAACGSDDGGDTSETTAATEPAVEPITIVVTNDDGIGAPGIDSLVTGLQGLEAVEIFVVAPAEDRTGTSDSTTPGGATYADGQTLSGVEGTAVDGFPADTIVVAVDELGIEPDLVVSGINIGQNVGPLAYLSGTVGAGRAAVRQGIPAVAGSAGLGADADFEGATTLVLDWITEHRDDLSGLADGGVVNINIPDCTMGTPRELLEVDLATVIPEGVNPFETDCSVEPTSPPTDDVAALAAGHPALSLVPPEEPPG
jgi:5'-nucleotidase